MREYLDRSVVLRLFLLTTSLVFAGKAMAAYTDLVVGSRYEQVGYDLTRNDLSEEMEQYKRAPIKEEGKTWAWILLLSAGLIASGFLLWSTSRLRVRLVCLSAVSAVAFAIGSRVQRQNVMKVASVRMVSNYGRILSDAEKDVLSARERCLRPHVEKALRKQVELLVHNENAKRDRKCVEQALKTVLYHDKVCWDLCYGYPYERLREMAWAIYGL